MPAAGKVLLLGGSGFLGGWIHDRLESDGTEVIAPAAGDRIDLRDGTALRKLVATVGPQVVVNAAGVTSPTAAESDPAALFAINVGGVMNLLEALRREAPRASFVAISSAAVYSDEPPFTERSRTGPTTAYAASKLAMEAFCHQYSRQYGMAITVLRCFNLIGPGEPASQASSEFARAAIAAGPGGEVTVRVGDPAITRDFTDVRDAARSIGLVLDPGVTGTFNLCSGESVSLGRMAELIGAETGADLRLAGSDTGRPASGLLRVSGKNRQLRQATGWQPEIALERSVADLVGSLRD